MLMRVPALVRVLVRVLLWVVARALLPLAGAPPRRRLRGIKLPLSLSLLLLQVLVLVWCWYCCWR